MKLFLYFSLALSALASPLDVPVKSTDVESLNAEGFAPLFNGTDLTEFDVRGAEATYSVKDGVIYGTAENLPKNSFLTTKKEYSDFIFSFEFRFENLEGNSGCMFRALYDEEKDRIYGYQCEHDNKERSWTAGLYDEGRRGWLFPRKENPGHGAAFTEQGARLFKTDDWNHIVIRCEAQKIQTWLNGELRVNFIDIDEKNTTPAGRFGLQVHSGKACAAAWRNLYIKELK